MKNICDDVDKILASDPSLITSETVEWHLMYCSICSRHGELIQDPNLWNPKTLNSSVSFDLPVPRLKDDTKSTV